MTNTPRQTCWKVAVPEQDFRVGYNIKSLLQGQFSICVNFGKSYAKAKPLSL